MDKESYIILYDVPTHFFKRTVTSVKDRSSQIFNEQFLDYELSYGIILKVIF